MVIAPSFSFVHLYFDYDCSRGGVLLIVSGDHLDSVESAILRVIAVADQNPDVIHREFHSVSMSTSLH